MDKVLYTGDQDPLLEAVGGELMTYFDCDRLIKSASSSVFSRKMVADHMPDKDHFGVHLIIIGASEPYGFNKNGDWWTRPGLTHTDGNYGMHTFVKNGHYFREHRNRDPKLKIGDIKAAAFNPAMERGEIIIWGDKRKAEKEYEEAKAGKQMSFSMSARVPFDECSICANEAKRSANYCTHLKNNMTRWMPKQSKFAYAINHKPNFFDASSVENRADRIAVHLQTMMGDEMKKAASASENEFLFSDTQADMEGVIIPDTLEQGCASGARQRWLTKLAAVETFIETAEAGSHDARYHYLKQAARFAFGPTELTDPQLDLLRKVEPSVMFGYLSKRAALIPFDVFYAYTTRQKIKVASEDTSCKYAHEKLLPRLFRDALESPVDYDLETMFIPASSIKVASAPTSSADESVMNLIVQKNTIKQAAVNQRMLYGSANETTFQDEVKSAAMNYTPEQISKATAVVRAYGLYKVAFVEALAELHGQDCIDDATLILINSQHNN